jgi:transcriptional regulator with XRE-family HTH domain
MNTTLTLTTYAKALKADREDAYLNQEELAKRIGSKQQTVSGWESGKSVPGPAYQAKLVEILGKHCRVSAIPKRGEFRLMLEAKHGEIAQDSVKGDAPATRTGEMRLGDKLAELFELMPQDPVMRAITFGKCAEIINQFGVTKLAFAPSHPGESTL